jgi:hypothetical protein
LINEIFENLMEDNQLIENLLCLHEHKSWEQIALGLYSVLGDMDTADDVCKAASGAFKKQVMEHLARKNQHISEAVATVNAIQKLVKKHGTVQSNKLVGSTHPGETGFKFFLLPDGKIVQVLRTHAQTAEESGVDLLDLRNAGVMDTYINKIQNELDVSGDKLTKQQINTLLRMYIPYHIKTVYTSVSGMGRGTTVKSKAALEYLLTYGTLDEAVVKTVPAKDTESVMLKKYGASIGKLDVSTYRGEEDYKFWLLTNGKLISVKKSHGASAADANVWWKDLMNQGTVRGWITTAKNPFSPGDMNVEANNKLTKKQISTLVGMFIPYQVRRIYLDAPWVTDRVHGRINNLKSKAELDYLLTYGTLDEGQFTPKILMTD